MKGITEKLKILIISGYHPKETFAVNVGECLFQNTSTHNLEAARYTGKPDRKTSTYNLRRFVEEFNPVISPIILHGDDDQAFDAAIIYCAKSKQEKRRALKPLSDFILRLDGGNLIVFGRFLTYNTRYNLIDLELNSKMGLQKAINLVEDFSRYLLNLYLEKGVKL